MQQNLALNQFARHRKDYLGRAMRSNRFRYVRWTESRTGKVVEAELYDHRTDPNENVKVAKRAEYASDLERLEQWLPELQGKVSSR